MSLVKWLRKNKQKIMVWVVVIIMITFVGGFSLRQLLASRGVNDEPIAKIDGKEITNIDRMQAGSELEILREMGAGQMLMSQRTLTGPLVGLLLFPNNRSSSMLDAQLKYAAMQGQLVIDTDIVQSFFKANDGDAAINWLLLNKEARELGCAVSDEEAMRVYKQVALGITRGEGNAAGIVANLSEKHSVPQEKIMFTFAKLLSVMSYVDSTTKLEDVTLPQIASQIGYENQKISSTHVEFSADKYTDQIDEVTDQELQEQFNNYKNVLSGNVTESNPYGFGYKIPDRVQLEYLIINFDAVKSLVKKPTEDEMEEHYSRNKSNYTEQVKKDPSDPESETESRTKSYAEVRDQIKNELLEQRTNSRAEMIMKDISSQVTQELRDKDTEKMTGEQIKQLVGDYAAAAKAAEEKNGITVYTGKTGYLSKDELLQDRNLGRVSKQREGRMPVNLASKAFSVKGLEAVSLGKFDGEAPKIYQNIGPMKGMYPQTFVLARVVDYKEEQIPEDLNTSYDVTKSSLEGEPKKETYTVKDDVLADCKILKAMDIAKRKAEKFLETAGKDWQAAIDKFNEEAETPLRLDETDNQNRIADSQIKKARLRAEVSGMPARRLEYQIRNKFKLDKLYELKDGSLPQATPLPPSKSVLAVKEVSVTSPTTEDYKNAKKETAATIEGNSSMKAAFIQLNADNIKTRTNFEYITQEQADVEQE